MTHEIFDQQFLLSSRRLEELWQRADKLQNPPEALWSQPDQGSQEQQELTKESLEELSFSLEELQVLVEELHLQNEELAKSHIELEAERQRYRELFELAPDGYLVTNPNGVIIEANHKAAQLLNVAQKHLIGKPLVIYIAAEKRQQFYTQLSQLRTGESINHWSVQIQGRQGGCFVASCAVTPIQNQQKQVVSLRWRLFELTSTENQTLEEQGNPAESHQARPLFPAVLRPVQSYSKEQTPSSNQLIESPRQQLVIATEQAGKLLNEIFSSTLDGFLITARTGKYIYVNRTVAQALGFAQSDFIGKTWRQLGLPSNLMERFDAQLEAVFRMGEPLTDEISLPTVNGVRVYEYTISLINDINSDPEAVIITGKDITKHKQAVEEASVALAKEKEMSALKSESAFVVAQELRNLLHNVFAYVELIGINTQLGTNDKKLNYFKRLQVNLRRINQLLDDLLWIGKIEAGELQLNPALLDLTKFCQELIEELQQGVDFKHKIVFSRQGPHSSVCMDRKLLRYILLNLLLNAIHYSPQGSEIKLDIFGYEGQVIFRIQDFGIGIPQKDQELIFKMFYRGSNVGAVAGKGLGLALVKQCVDLQEGEISVESEEGVGTTCTVTLPLNLLATVDKKEMIKKDEEKDEG